MLKFETRKVFIASLSRKRVDSGARMFIVVNKARGLTEKLIKKVSY